MLSRLENLAQLDNRMACRLADIFAAASQPWMRVRVTVEHTNESAGWIGTDEHVRWFPKDPKRDYESLTALLTMSLQGGRTRAPGALHVLRDREIYVNWFGEDYFVPWSEVTCLGTTIYGGPDNSAGFWQVEFEAIYNSFKPWPSVVP
jgi:hypothetical protein